MGEDKSAIINENLKWISENINELSIGEAKKMGELIEEMYSVTSEIVNAHTLCRRFLVMPNKDGIF